MVNLLPNSGEQYRKKLLSGSIAPPTSYFVGLIDSNTDTIDETTDADDLESEPDDGNYQRLQYDLGTATLGETLDANNDWQLVMNEQTFDLVNTTGGYVDHGVVVVRYQADGESSENDHAFFFVKLTDAQGNPTRIDLEGTNEATFSATLTDVEPSG